MKEYWYQATYLLETLIFKLRGLAEDGMELFFTSSNIKVTGTKADHFMKAMRMSEAIPKPGVRTDLTPSLGQVLDAYMPRLDESSRKRLAPKSLLLIVLTDGVWQDMPDVDKLLSTIVKFANASNLKTSLERPIGIQFISFGEDGSGLSQLLWRLDDVLANELLRYV
jgi:hypothetical protein